MKYLSILLLLLFVGCSEQKTEKIDLATFEVHSAYSIIYEKGQSPVIPPAPNNQVHARDKCPTGGWIVQGDGNRTRCPNCDPPYLSNDESTPVEPKVEVVKPTQPTKPVVVQPKQQVLKRYYYYDPKLRKWFYYEKYE